MKIFFYENQKSKYAVLQTFQKEFEKALVRAHHEVYTSNFEEAIQTISEVSPDCTCGFNIVFEDEMLCSSYGIPHVAFCVDMPNHFPELVETKHVLAGFPDEDAVAFLQYFGFQNSFFFPHAISQEIFLKYSEEHIINSKRDLDVVLLGSFIDDEHLTRLWKELFSREFIASLEEIVIETLSSSTISYAQRVIQLLESSQTFRAELEAKKMHPFDLVSMVEAKVRAEDRKMLVDAIDQPVHIFCTDDDRLRWQKVCKKKQKLIFHPAVLYSEVPSILMRTKYFLHSAPFFKKGLHERLLLGLSCGASPVTSTSEFLCREFPASEALVYYLFDSMKDVASQINEGLTVEHKRLEKVIKARRHVEQFHTWDQRVPLFLDKVLSWMAHQ